MNAPTPDPSLIACHIDESAGMDPTVPGNAWPFAPGDVVRDSGEDGDDAAWLDAAPVGTVVTDAEGDDWIRVDQGWRYRAGKATTAGTVHQVWASVNLHETYGPLTVVSVPTHAARPATSGARGAGRAQAAAQRALDEQRAAGTPPNLTLGERIRLAAEGPNVPYSTRSYLELLATDADTLTRVGEKLVAAAQESAATPAVGVRASEGATGAPGGAGEVGLGDALRAYDGPMWYAHPQLAALADRADALERTRDELSRQCDEYLHTSETDLVQDAYGRAAREKHRAERAEAQVERVRAQLVRMTKSSVVETRRHGIALLHILDGTQ